MAKENNSIIWIIGIGIVLFLVLTQTNIFKKQQESSSISINYYDKEGNKIIPKYEVPIRNPFSLFAIFSPSISSIWNPSYRYSDGTTCGYRNYLPVYIGKGTGFCGYTTNYASAFVFPTTGIPKYGTVASTDFCFSYNSGSGKTLSLAASGTGICMSGCDATSLWSEVTSGGVGGANYILSSSCSPCIRFVSEAPSIESAIKYDRPFSIKMIPLNTGDSQTTITSINSLTINYNYASIDFTVTALNNGNVLYENVYISGYSSNLPSGIFPVTNYSLPIGSSINWTSSKIEVGSGWAETTKIFLVNISGYNTYTKQVEVRNASISVGF